MKTINAKWIWGVAILLVLNLLLLISMLVQNKKEPGPEPIPFLEEALQFDEQQSRAFDALKKEHHQKMTEKNEEIRKLKDRFFEGIKNDTLVSESHIISQQIGTMVSEIEMMTFDHFKEVRALCRPDQKKKFDEIIINLLQGAHQRPGPPMGPHGEKRGPGPPNNGPGIGPPK